MENIEIEVNEVTLKSWNPVLNLVIKIKRDYIETFGKLDTYNFEGWLNKLNKKEYNDVFECLQINQDGQIILIRYGLAEMQEGMWTDPNSIYRECRSIVIDLEKEQLVLTPFRKFFNLNEVEENKIETVINKINHAKVVEVADKLDGSMHSARWYNDDVFYTGSMAINKKDSWRLQDGYSMLTNNHMNMFRENDNLTFTFEYISLQDAHVVMYKKSEEGLYLIGVRDVITGKQLYYSEVQELAFRYNIEAVKLENKTLEQILEEMKVHKSHEKEGWILNIDGHFIKIKCDDYVHIHRILDKLSSVNVIIQAVAEENYDDLISKVPEIYRDRINKIARLIMDYVKNTNKEVKRIYNVAPKENKKEFMIWVDKNAPKEIKAYIRNLYLNKPYNLLKRRHEGYKRLKELGLDKEFSALFHNEGE